MKQVPLKTLVNGKLEVAGIADVAIDDNNDYVVTVDIYPGSVLARRLFETGRGDFSIGFADVRESIGGTNG